jgi:hypothetical protein
MPGGPMPLNGFGGQMHPLGMGMPQMHAMSPSMMHGPPPGVMLNQNQQQQQQQVHHIPFFFFHVFSNYLIVPASDSKRTKK